MSVLPTPMNSTIVRINDVARPALVASQPLLGSQGSAGIRRYEDDIPRTLALTLGLWGAGVAAGVHAGVFSRLPLEVVGALSALFSAWAIVMASSDRNLRDWFEAHAALGAQLGLLSLGAAMVSAGTALGDGVPVHAADAALWLTMLFFAPLALMFGVSAARIAWLHVARNRVAGNLSGVTAAAYCPSADCRNGTNAS